MKSASVILIGYWPQLWHQITKVFNSVWTPTFSCSLLPRGTCFYCLLLSTLRDICLNASLVDDDYIWRLCIMVIICFEFTAPSSDWVIDWLIDWFTDIPVCGDKERDRRRQLKKLKSKFGLAVSCDHDFSFVCEYWNSLQIRSEGLKRFETPKIAVFAF